jgi:DNA-binding GntR family transcriptional regulator
MEETIAQMEKAWREEDLEMLSSASARFHDLIVSAAREARVRELIQHLSDLNPQLSLYQYSLPQRIPEAIREHHAIYEAIRARDITAEDLARLHTRNAMLAQTRARHLSGE